MEVHKYDAGTGVVAEPKGFIIGLGRDYPHPRKSHLYKGTFSDPGLPMCRFGWNRENGTEYSIWRGNIGVDGICKICEKRADKGLEGVEPHATVKP